MNLFFWRTPERDTGRLGESLAARFLKKRGYRILRRNCRNRYGEIDLIARDGDAVVFVEVKTRATGAWGDPAEAVDRHKRRKLRLAAESFATRARIRHLPLRFDVVSIVLNDSDTPEVLHYKNAFRMDEE